MRNALQWFETPKMKHILLSFCYLWNLWLSFTLKAQWLLYELQDLVLVVVEETSGSIMIPNDS